MTVRFDILLTATWIRVSPEKFFCSVLLQVYVSFCFLGWQKSLSCLKSPFFFLLKSTKVDDLVFINFSISKSSDIKLHVHQIQAPVTFARYHVKKNIKSMRNDYRTNQEIHNGKMLTTATGIFSFPLFLTYKHVPSYSS